MSDKDVEVESEESEIDEDDPLAPQLHYIRMQKKLKKIDQKMNPWIEKARAFAPILKIFEKSMKYIIILGVLGGLFYYNIDGMGNLNTKMNQRYNRRNGEEPIDESSLGWVFMMVEEMFSESASWYTIKELGFYIGLFAFSFIAYAILARYNDRYEQKIKEIEEKAKENAKEKAKEKAKEEEKQKEKDKNNFNIKPKID